MAAGEKLTWMFELLDKMSGPADKISKSLGKLNPPLKSSTAGAGLFAKGIGMIGKTFGPAAAGAVVRFASAAVNLAGKLGPVTGALGSVATKGFSVLSKGAMVAGGAVVAVAAAVAVAGIGIGIAGANFALHFLTFKEDSIAAFKAMTGSREAADRIFSKAVKFASVTPFKESEVVSMTQALTTRGFKEDELGTLMKGVGDVGALLGTEKMESVINALGKMRANGKMTGETLQMLADAGINAQLVYDALGKSLGKTRPQIDAMMQSGKITDKEGIDAAMSAIAKGMSGGELGGAMAEKSRTVNGLMSTLEGRPEALLAHADFEPLMAPLKQFLNLLIDTLGPDTPLGERIIALFEMIGKGVGEMFGVLNGTDIGAGIGKVLDVIEPLMKMMMGAGKSWITTLIKGLQLIGGHLDKLTPDQVNQLVRAMSIMGEIAAVTLIVIGTLVAAVLALPFAFIYAATQVYDIFADLWKRLDDPAQWQQVGIDIMWGLINGLLSMSSPSTDAANRIAGMMADKFKTAFGVGGAPVVAPIGPEPGTGASPATNPYAGGTSSFGSSPVAGATPPPQVTVQMTGDVNVNAADVGDDPNAHGKAAASSFKASLASELAKLGLGSGGG